ncbi:NTP transferase domain-containing protein [Neptunicella sp.]|uniref:NTP transferase domain-containing protein n=1 Tax=Neptunicella sp. TaxID=2125986 RepID=UPI003F68C6C9
MLCFNGLVLAGGKSSRMGQDKAMLRVNNETLLMRCRRILIETGAKQVMISRNDGNPQHIVDTFMGKGPLGGIHAAIEQTSTLPLLVLPVDLPLVSSQMLNKLVEEGFNQQTSCRYEKHNLPVFIFRPAELLTSLYHTLITDQDLSVGRFFAGFPIQNLPLKNPNALTNTNTLAEWQASQTESIIENML